MTEFMSLRLLVGGFLLTFLSSVQTSGAAAEGERPNIVLILADDLGWADLACSGNRFNETPHIDRLASEGVRFTNFYAGPVCSPTRANLQSGQDQARFGITQHIPGHRRPFARLTDPVVSPHLPLEVETFAERLRQVGYQTGYFGKWHLGGPGYGPQAQGWDTAIELTGHTVPKKLAALGKENRTAAFLTSQAIQFISANRDQPFLVQISHSAVHLPISPSPTLIEKYRSKPAMEGYPSLPGYAALVEELDNAVGELLAGLQRLNLADDTLIIFVSDNGGLVHQQSGSIVTSNAPLRGEKGTLYEGGIRVPAIVRWPGHVDAAGIIDVPCTTMDLYPTLVKVANARPADQPQDGVAIDTLWSKSPASLQRDSLYWHLPHYHHSTPASAIRRGRWKLIEFFESQSLELYDLQSDPSEAHNLAAANPEKANELQTALAQWRMKVSAQMPVSNPQYDPQKADQLGRKPSARSAR
ncbi:MAG: sulfatase [Planctomycetaceae bacterium]